MPIYDYQCRACGHRFERRQGFEADPLDVCPRCQGEAPRRFHSVAVIYKGSGFYTTDYARKPLNESGDSDKSAASEGSSASPDKVPDKVPEKTKEEVKSSED